MKFAAVLAVLALGTLAGCNQEAVTALAASGVAKPGITLSEGRLRLPAVTGNPGAAYFTVANTGTSGTVSISSIAIEGATKTEMHKTKDGAMSPVNRLDVEAGSTVKFAPGGLHVMAFDLDPALAAGGTTNLTVNFADGAKADLPLALEAAGSADHGSSH